MPAGTVLCRLIAIQGGAIGIASIQAAPQRPGHRSGPRPLALLGPVHPAIDTRAVALKNLRRTLLLVHRLLWLFVGLAEIAVRITVSGRPSVFADVHCPQGSINADAQHRLQRGKRN